jgi:hypothetical protein
MGGKKDSLLVTVKFFDAERGNFFSLLAEAGDIVLLKEGENNSIEKMIFDYHLIQWLRCEDRLSIDGMITRMGYSSKIARQSLVTAARSVISSAG